MERLGMAARKISADAGMPELVLVTTGMGEIYQYILTPVGVEGKKFRPIMAQTVSFAILGAFILSLTYVPMVSALFLSKNPNPKPNFSDLLIAEA